MRDRSGAASFGADFPEKPYKKAFAPRLGLTYALNTKTLIRAGWGIFYDRAFYPGWVGAISQDGFSSNVAFDSTLGGLQPAFLLQDASPRTSPPRPSSSPTSATVRASRTAPSTPTNEPAPSNGT